MKKQIFSILFLLIAGLSFGQTSYQYVIIPTQFPELGNGFNPYNICTSIQKVLSDKSFASKIQTDAIPDDYCDALTVNVIKASSLLKNKLKVELKNCRNQVVWTAEGTGYSKEYPEGYAEAFADALSGLEKLPDNAMAGRATATNLQSTSEVISEKDVTNYKPRNPYYNSTYFVDLTSGEGGILNLIIINGKLLGYKDLQVIGTLTPTGLENVYSLNWVDANGDQLTGVANLSDTELKISLPSGSTATVITLKKL